MVFLPPVLRQFVSKCVQMNGNDYRFIVILLCNSPCYIHALPDFYQYVHVKHDNVVCICMLDLICTATDILHFQEHFIPHLTAKTGP